MTLTDFLAAQGHRIVEGYSQQCMPKILDLVALTNKPNLRIMEIGFNAGHSAEVFMKSNPTSILTSFDLGIHAYVQAGKKYIDTQFPGRHTLILGDSTQTVPKFISENPDARFDIIFIDGGHDYAVAKADVHNCMRLAHKDTVVILDDTVYKHGWEQGYSIGPTKVWCESVDSGIIKEVMRKDYSIGQGMSWGYYTIPN